MCSQNHTAGIARSSQRASESTTRLRPALPLPSDAAQAGALVRRVPCRAGPSGRHPRGRDASPPPSTVFRGAGPLIMLVGSPTARVRVRTALAYAKPPQKKNISPASADTDSDVLPAPTCLLPPRPHLHMHLRERPRLCRQRRPSTRPRPLCASPGTAAAASATTLLLPRSQSCRVAARRALPPTRPERARAANACAAPPRQHVARIPEHRGTSRRAVCVRAPA